MGQYWLGSDAFWKAKEEWVLPIQELVRDFESDDFEMILTSSGTTGVPKEFRFSKKQVIASAYRTLKTFGLRKGMKAMLPISSHYVGGKMMIIRSILGEIDLLLLEPSRSPLKNVEGFFDFAPMVPLQVLNSSEEDLTRLKKVIIGGASVSSLLQEKIRKIESVDFFEVFGMSETLSNFSFRDLRNEKSFFSLQDGVEIRVDERSCLMVSVEGVTDGFLSTNDVVDLKNGGFEWKGRFDFVVNSGGVKLFPEQLEAALNDFLNQGDKVVFYGVQSSDYGQELVGFYYGDLESSISEMESRLVSLFGKYAKPRFWRRILDLKFTSSGKFDRVSTIESII